ncbi:alpha/beta hydrolase [Planctomicrobium piriforme]|uniref:Phospholipase/carboxylesterase n=1 Tax=Planctomicrobium piriforme TaxID=1576369 RepID=A0A1I3JA41_9PLAN|nr:dienelactone hydrolase family protein [Planctomicrobium piriforme]SFI57112.1 phospholipase/carboxylesterase [Planctomicrobium piriforme]
MATLEWRQYGALDAHVITAEPAPQLAAIFCHGFGAPGDDLVPLGAQLLQQFPSLLDQVEILMPCAPLSLADQGLPNSRAWWPLDLERLSRTIELSNFDDLRREVPDQLATSRELLLDLIKEVMTTRGLSAGQIVLGGFSQGSMLATDVAMRMPEPPGGLIIWSGTLLNEEDWTQRAPRLKDVPVVQSHGREDPILPYESATWLRDLLTGAGAKIKFIGFRGPHTIPNEAVKAAGQLLESLLDTSTETH